MFTGLIEKIGTVKNIRKAGNGIYLTISSHSILNGTQIGDSINIDGACQTVTKIEGDSFTVFTSSVTCNLTTLGNFQVNRRVNLERALSPSSRMGGHIVQGHIDGKGLINKMLRDGNGMTIEITVSEDILKYIVEKGSVAVNGISLTVVSLTDSSFNLYVIPETIQKTTLNESVTGTEVNIEVDILAKYVEKMIFKTIEVDKDKGLKKRLIEGGFM
ncbi:MAG: riboflavin synthase [Spirochaetota bacterium]|nr:riboflavin synthase [Spirochaetota bacterium]